MADHVMIQLEKHMAVSIFLIQNILLSILEIMV